MLDRNMTKAEVEKELARKGDFVQIDYLTRYLGQKPPIAMRRFAFQKLSELYEKKGMYSEAAKMYGGIAANSIVFTDKIKNYVKEAEMFVKAGLFDNADHSVKKALGEANASQRAEVFASIKEIYRNNAEEYEKKLKRAHAAKVYEKLIDMNLSVVEKKEIIDKLLPLYEKLGKLNEYYRLKRVKESL